MRSPHALALAVGLTGLVTACGEDGNGPSNTPPAAAFTPSCALLVCAFADGSSDADGQVTTYTWDFGDGAEATTQYPTHAYASAGTYIVALAVTDDRGATGTLSQPVTVAGPQTGRPTADFTGLCVVGGHIGRIVFVDCTFTDQSTAAAGATVTAWTWDFGDGKTATEQNPAVQHYTRAWTGTGPGSVAVTLTVTDNNGLTNGIRKSVPVSVAPTTPTIGLSLPPVRGTYFGSITVSAAGASNSPQTVSVRLDY